MSTRNYLDNKLKQAYDILDDVEQQIEKELGRGSKPGRAVTDTIIALGDARVHVQNAAFPSDQR